VFLYWFFWWRKAEPTEASQPLVTSE